MKCFEDYTLVVPRIPLARAHHEASIFGRKLFFCHRKSSLTFTTAERPSPPWGRAHCFSLLSYLDWSLLLNTGQIRTEPAEVSQGHWSSVQAGLGFYTDLAHRPDICHRLLSFLRTSRGWLELRKHPPGKVVSQNFFIREKDYRVIRCPDWCFTVLCQVLGLSMCGFPGLLQRSQAGRGDMTWGASTSLSRRLGAGWHGRRAKQSKATATNDSLGKRSRCGSAGFWPSRWGEPWEVTSNTSNWSSTSNSRWENPVFPAPLSRPCFVSLGGWVTQTRQNCSHESLPRLPFGMWVRE